MKIAARRPARLHPSRSRDDVAALLRQPTDREQRPCADCVDVCPCPKQSATCTCQCSPDCPQASRFLSSDPQRYPIEGRAVPVVYALSTLRVVETCWSCEGHATGVEGCKPPQVWFYSASTVYLQLIQQHLNDLCAAGRLKSTWKLAVNEYQPEADLTLFVMQPSATDRSLESLQRDFVLIGETLLAGVHELARKQGAT